MDAARGLAILLVIVTHAGAAVTGLPQALARLVFASQFGVQLFFVASAFTLCVSTGAAPGMRLDWRAFLIKRFFRIAPLYYTGIVVYFLVNCRTNWRAGGAFAPSAPYDAVNILANVAFLHGLYPPANNDIVPGGWSIATEFLFYAMFPLLVPPLMHWLRDASWLRIFLAPAAGLAAALATAWTLPSIGALPPALEGFFYCSVLNQLSCFTAGITLYVWWRHRTSRPLPRWTPVVALGALAAALLASTSPTLTAKCVMPWLCGIGFAAGLAWHSSRPGWWMNALAIVGRRSFSMYIFHFLFAIQGAAWVVKHLGHRLPPTALFGVLTLFIAGGAFAVASLTEPAIEQRGIRLGRALVARLARPTDAPPLGTGTSRGESS